MNRSRPTVLTTSYVGSRYEYDVKLGHHVVQVREPAARPDRATCSSPSSPTSALLYPEGRAQRGERELLTV